MWLPGRIHYCPADMEMDRADMESSPTLKSRGITPAGNNTQWVKAKHPVIILANS